MSEKKSVSSKPEKIDLYFDVRDSSYLLELNARYVVMKKADIKIRLQAIGYRDDAYVNTREGSVRETEFPFYEAQNRRMIDYAGSLAGHRVGIFKDGAGRAFLVTEEPRGVWDDVPKKVAQPEFFSSFLEELLPDQQAERFCYWLSVALQSLRRGDFRPGQVVILAGPPRCGKSLLQDIITEVLGGRSANPWRYMMELTQFNKNMAGAEHWKIEDPPSTTDIRTRRMLGSNLKNCAFTRDFPVHAKTKDELNLPLFRRITISVNDETENLAVIPPLETSINDKLTIFHCHPVQNALAPFRGKHGTPNLFKDLKTDGDLDRNAVWKQVMEEIPQIRAWLLKAFKTVPRAWVEDRCGVIWWHHPELERELTSLAPEHRCLQLIDHVFFSETEALPITDRKAFDLENDLGQKAPAQTQQIGRHQNWMGTYLGRLCKAGHSRISKRVKDGTTLWTIKPPVKTQD